MFKSRKLRGCSIPVLELCSAETSNDYTPLSLMGALFFSILFCWFCCLKETKKGDSKNTGWKSPSLDSFSCINFCLGLLERITREHKVESKNKVCFYIIRQVFSLVLNYFA